MKDWTRSLVDHLIDAVEVYLNGQHGEGERALSASEWFASARQQRLAGAASAAAEGERAEEARA